MRTKGTMQMNDLDDIENSDKVKDVVEKVLSGEHDLGEFYMQLTQMEFYAAERKLEKIRSDRKKTEENGFFTIGERKIWFSRHSVEKFRDRHIDLCDKTDEEIRRIMKKVSSCAAFHEVKPKRKYAIRQILNHDFEKTKWYMDANGFVWVVVDDTLKTVHHNEAKRYEQFLSGIIKAMNTYEKLMSDIKSAMIDKNNVKRDCLRSIVSELNYAATKDDCVFSAFQL